RDGHVTGVQTCALPILELGRAVTALRLDVLGDLLGYFYPETTFAIGAVRVGVGRHIPAVYVHQPASVFTNRMGRDLLKLTSAYRSEERRVGKEGRVWWS